MSGDRIIGVFFTVEGGASTEALVKTPCLLVLVSSEAAATDGSEEPHSAEPSLEATLGFVCEEKVTFCS